jgi:hypothetical protein
MASGGFCVPGARHLERRFATSPHHRVERVVVNLTVMGLPDPLAQGFIGGQTSRLLQGLCDRGQYLRREGQGLASGHVERQPGLHAPSCVAGEPMADGMAMDSQQLGHLLAGLGLPTRQHIEHLESRFLATMRFPLSPLLEGLDIFSNNWDSFAHHLLSSKATGRPS